MAPDSRTKNAVFYCKTFGFWRFPNIEPVPGIAQGSTGDRDFVAQASLAEDKRRYNYLLGVVVVIVVSSEQGSNTPMGRRPGEFHYIKQVGS